MYCFLILFLHCLRFFICLDHDEDGEDDNYYSDYNDDFDDVGDDDDRGSVLVEVNADYDADRYSYRVLPEIMERKITTEKKKQQHLYYFLQLPFLLYSFFQFQRHQKYDEMMMNSDDGAVFLLHLLGDRYEVSTTKTLER
jgi:hypothetical protein